MKLISVKQSSNKKKKYMAEFCSCEGKSECKPGERKVIHFGAAGSSTYLDNKDEKKREAYLARHIKNEDWNNPKTAGSLSRFLLWGDTTSLSKNIAIFKKKFGL